ncbi:hypothetical protein B5807_08206 [Epicoccum nigrum]|uniref:Uncharacterized protein n=1 Tax=Epicoccum nigrum TaxID=105696 RepID=A0A1Y2LQF1_EPING|nr:hypothetical protein B5807_08206 [Epicoccum nigrum]
MGRREFYICYYGINNKYPDTNSYYERPAVQSLYSRKRWPSHQPTRHTQTAVHVTLGVSKSIHSGYATFVAAAWAVEAFLILKQHELVYVQGSTGDAYAEPAEYSVSIRAKCECKECRA